MNLITVVLISFLEDIKPHPKDKVSRANLILLSRFDKNLPKILMASTRKPPLSSMLMIVATHSYRIAFPAFLFDSVLVATCENK